MELDDLIAAHNELVQRVRNLAADRAAQGMLLDAFVVALPPGVRSAVTANFTALSEQYLARMLAGSQDPTDQALHAQQAAIERMKARLAGLPRGQ